MTLMKGERLFIYIMAMLPIRLTLSAWCKRPNPTEIYNLAAQSHVLVSFETPEYTANADALGPLRLLEAIRILNR